MTEPVVLEAQGLIDDPKLANRRSLGMSFRKVWLSVAISSSGDGMFLTAFPLLALTVTQDPLLIAGVTVASRLPWLFFSMVTGAIADRMDRRSLMVAADIARFAVVAVLGAVIVGGLASVPILYGCAFLLGLSETVHTNSAQAILPTIVRRADLMQANARLGSIQVATAQFVGPPIGTILFGIAASLPFFADAVTFAGSAALVATMPDEHAVEPPTTRLRDDVREGVRFMIHHPVLRRLAVLLGVVNFFYFAAESLLVLFTAQRLHSGRFVYTLLFIAAATGTVVSRWLVTAMVRRVGFVRTISVSFWTWAVTMVGLSCTTSPAAAIGLFFALGIGNGLWTALANTVRQQLTPNRLLGRMNAAYRTVAWGVVPFGAAFGGLSAQLFGIRAPFIVAGVAHVVVACFALRLLRPVRGAGFD
ncbi:MAG TPA: MFS transporter [Ilumatobacteraceae bacterium]|nr:MFS transporter [Ilumatobacteraceae bacterium]